MKTAIKNLLFVGVFSATTSALALAQTAEIVATAIHHGGQIHYSYVVKNTGTVPITHFWIGTASSQSAGFDFKLSVSPSLQSDSLFVATESNRTPTGWAAVFKPTEEDPSFTIEFTDLFDYKKRWTGWVPTGNEPKPLNAPNYITPGQTLAGFEVMVPEIDKGYFSVATVFDDNGNSTVVQVQNPDKQPPVVQMQGTATPDGVHYVIDTNLVIKDDVDPHPEHKAMLTRRDTATGGNVEELPAPKHLKQFRVTALPGKTYTLTVTAQDASGNTGSANYSWSIPQKGAAH